MPFGALKREILIQDERLRVSWFHGGKEPNALRGIETRQADMALNPSRCKRGKEPNALRGIETDQPCTKPPKRAAPCPVEKNLMPFGALKHSIGYCLINDRRGAVESGKEPNALRGIETSMPLRHQMPVPWGRGKEPNALRGIEIKISEIAHTCS